MASINFNSRDPIYLQVILEFRKQLVSDQLRLGEELPSRREIARQLNINPNTVQRAFSEMEALNWISTEPNRPSRVTADPTIIHQVKREFVEQAIHDFVTSIRTIDISYQEVVELLDKEMNTQKKENGGKTDD